MTHEELIKRARESCPANGFGCSCCSKVPQLTDALQNEVTRNVSFGRALEDLHKGRHIAEQAALNLAEDYCNVTSGDPHDAVLNALRCASDLVEKMSDKELLKRALVLAEKPPENRYCDEEGLSVLDALLIDSSNYVGPWDWCLQPELILHFNARKLIPQLIAELRSSREDYDELEGISESNGTVAERLQADVDKLRAENTLLEELANQPHDRQILIREWVAARAEIDRLRAESRANEAELKASRTLIDYFRELQKVYKTNCLDGYLMDLNNRYDEAVEQRK